MMSVLHLDTLSSPFSTPTHTHHSPLTTLLPTPTPLPTPSSSSPFSRPPTHSPVPSPQPNLPRCFVQTGDHQCCPKQFVRRCRGRAGVATRAKERPCSTCKGGPPLPTGWRRGQNQWVGERKGGAWRPWSSLAVLGGGGDGVDFSCLAILLDRAVEEEQRQKL